MLELSLPVVESLEMIIVIPLSAQGLWDENKTHGQWEKSDKGKEIENPSFFDTPKPWYRDMKCCLLDWLVGFF